jgi:hypothetical protein
MVASLRATRGVDMEITSPVVETDVTNQEGAIVGEEVTTIKGIAVFLSVIVNRLINASTVMVVTVNMTGDPGILRAAVLQSKVARAMMGELGS